jgi:hypothetical protein
MAQTSFSRNGAFWPVSLSLFQGARRFVDDASESMLLSRIAGGVCAERRGGKGGVYRR